MNTQFAEYTETRLGDLSSDVITGKPFAVGSDFKALSFRHPAFRGLMDPLVMVDHYTMTDSTFGAHPHAGLAAVSVLFEDSVGAFNNRDSLGNDIDLQPGDLYWLHAGKGAVHDEAPLAGAKTHGLQMFVNLPARLKHSEPESLHVKASNMPHLTGPGWRVRLVAGQSCGVKGAVSPHIPLTILDGFLDQGEFQHQPSTGCNTWIYCVDGELNLTAGEQRIQLVKGQSIAINPMQLVPLIKLASTDQAHFALVEGVPVRENFVQQGPFVMSSQAEINTLLQDHAEGKLGSI